MLALELDELKDLGLDLDLTGFEPKDIDKIISDANGAQSKEDDFDLGEALKKAAFVENGDLWQIGNHRLICGDSTNAETYKRLMGGVKANAVVTDPPYGINYKGKAGAIKNDSFGDDSGLYTFLSEAFVCMAANLAPDGAAYIFHADSKGAVFRKAFDDAGFYLSACCIWVKNTFTLGRSHYQWQHEPCLYGWHKKGTGGWKGDRKQSTVWSVDKPQRSAEHPTMKPIPLLAIPLQNSTLTNGIILEPFCGSGSTIVCAEQLQRVCYAIELDPKFVSATLRRAAEAGIPQEKICCCRNGVKVFYADVVKEVEK